MLRSTQMKRFALSMLSVGLAGALATATTARAQQGEAVVASTSVTATVTKIDYKTRAVTLKTQDGKVHEIIADTAVRNLAQVKPGDVITATYAEALAYEVVKKGAKAPGVEQVVGGGRAEPGKKPAGAIGQQTTVTVTISAIDRSVPSVTFTGPQGNSRTIKVKHPEKLEGVNVGDMVDITYTEALAITVDPAPKK
jgi:Cu/Ag efflux protein CusF